MTTQRKRRRRTQSKPLSAAEIRRFEAIRLLRRWSYRKLAEEVSRVCQVAMPEPTMMKALYGCRVRPTTSSPLRRFLSAHPRESSEVV